MADTRTTSETPLAAHPPHPHPHAHIPRFAWPTLVLQAVGTAVFAAVTVGVITRSIPLWLAVVLNTWAIYSMFLVAHEGSHGILSTVRWVNPVAGRIAWLLFVPYISLPAFHYAHSEHHRHTNEGAKDPDMFATHGPGWQLPLRWALMDAFYTVWYFQHLPERLRRGKRRPLTELAEVAVVLPLFLVGLVWITATGHLWIMIYVFLLPQRLALVVVGWWFDWLPHHGLQDTHHSDRYRATRLRVGLEPLLIPLMLCQSYHLVHHLHPGMPFYWMWRLWRRDEGGYLAHNPMIVTVLGEQLTAEQYRAWRGAHPFRLAEPDPVG